MKRKIPLGSRTKNTKVILKLRERNFDKQEELCKDIPCLIVQGISYKKQKVRNFKMKEQRRKKS